MTRNLVKVLGSLFLIGIVLFLLLTIVALGAELFQGTIEARVTALLVVVGLGATAVGCIALLRWIWRRRTRAAETKQEATPPLPSKRARRRRRRGTSDEIRTPLYLWVVWLTIILGPLVLISWLLYESGAHRSLDGLAALVFIGGFAAIGSMRLWAPRLVLGEDRMRWRSLLLRWKEVRFSDVQRIRDCRPKILAKERVWRLRLGGEEAEHVLLLPAMEGAQRAGLLARIRRHSPGLEYVGMGR